MQKKSDNLHLSMYPILVNLGGVPDDSSAVLSCCYNHLNLDALERDTPIAVPWISGRSVCPAHHR